MNEHLGYAGDVTPQEAYDAVESGRGRLIDVRTAAEWTYVGVPVMPGERAVGFVEWVSYPNGTPNGAFVDQLTHSGVEPGEPLYFLCRSGVRSVAAAQAATGAGLGPAYNILEGFEGPHDADGHRTVAGWKVAGLPWRQG
ncbi:MAG: rhodanese-like domain-containing protein [Phycicoccus sp.]|nr:rhodanese-like domain-containing protein [Phycicoccus sp.]